MPAVCQESHSHPRVSPPSITLNRVTDNAGADREAQENMINIMGNGTYPHQWIVHFNVMNQPLLQGHNKSWRHIPDMLPSSWRQRAVRYEKLDTKSPLAISCHTRHYSTHFVGEHKEGFCRIPYKPISVFALCFLLMPSFQKVSSIWKLLANIA